MRYVKNLLLGMVFCFTATAAMAGNLDSPAGPTDASSAMYKLEDVYNRANDGTVGTKRTTTYGEPSVAPGPTGKTLTQVYDLVSERSRPAKTGQTPTVPIVAPVGSDGNLQKGVTWPSSSSVPSSARFTSNSANTVTDNLTGLMWAKNANHAGSTKTWTEALTYCNDLTIDTYIDWHLPNRFELESLLDLAYFNPALSNDAGIGPQSGGSSSFTGVLLGGYWSSTTYADTTANAWNVYLNYGSVGVGVKTGKLSVWPVRGGQ
jgi:hypothetical protein